VRPGPAEALREIVPPRALRTGVAAAPWSGPGGVPVVVPRSPEEAATVLARASEEGWRTLLAGAGTWLRSVPGAREAELIVSAAAQDLVTEYEPADLTLTAGAGLPLEVLERHTEEEGQWLPLDPPGAPRASLGGLVATGAAGPLRAAYGTPRDHVLGLTLVTGDGRVLRCGGRVVKNVAGYDLTRLAVGSTGSLGLVCSVTVRLFPLPEADATVLVRAARAEELVEPLRAVAGGPLPVAAVELLEGDGAVPAPGGAVLAVRAVGSREAVEEIVARLAGTLGPASGLAGDGPACSKSFFVSPDFFKSVCKTSLLSIAASKKSSLEIKLSLCCCASLSIRFSIRVNSLAICTSPAMPVTVAIRSNSSFKA